MYDGDQYNSHLSSKRVEVDQNPHPEITELNQLVEALKKNESKYRRLIENSPDIIYLFSDKKGGTYYAPVVEKVLGYTPQFLYDHPFLWNESIHPEDRELISHTIKDSERGLPFTIEYRIQDINGNWLWFLDRSIEISSQNGETVIEGMVTNITKQKMADAELTAAKEKAEEGNRLKSAFLNNMSHEVRTPMTAIVGFSNLLELADEEERKNYVKIIRKSADQLLSLFEDILHISRLQSEKLPVNKSEFCPGELLMEVELLYRHPDFDKPIQFLITLPENYQNHAICTDVHKLRQVLTNLLSNAYKYTMKGTIELGYRIDEQVITFFVRDTGLGIPDKEKELVFNQFFRGEEARNLAIGGTGLGLNIAREIVLLLGGTIFLESAHGKGSSFYFSLPLNNERKPCE